MRNITAWGAFVGESFVNTIREADFQRAVQLMDRDLVEGCLRGDKMMQDMLFYKYSRLIYKVCFDQMGNEEDADDVAMKTYAKIFRSLHTLEDPDALKSWIRTIVTRNCIEELRKKSNAAKRGGGGVDETDMSRPDQSVDIGGDVENKDLRRVLEMLPEGFRKVFVLYSVYGWSHKEIAEELGIDVGTSKSQYSRAKKRILDELKKLGQRP